MKAVYIAVMVTPGQDYGNTSHTDFLNVIQEAGRINNTVFEK